MPPTIPGTYRLTWVQGVSIPWRPSPCDRLSRPPTTMTPPTLPRFHRPLGRAPLQGSLPRSRCRTLRGRLGGGSPVQPNRSLRLLTGDRVGQVYLSRPRRRAVMPGAGEPGESSPPQAPGHRPTRSGPLSQRSRFPLARTRVAASGTRGPGQGWQADRAGLHRILVWRGGSLPKVETRFAGTHHATSLPSLAYWPPVSAARVPFRASCLTVGGQPPAAPAQGHASRLYDRQSYEHSALSLIPATRLVAHLDLDPPGPAGAGGRLRGRDRGRSPSRCAKRSAGGPRCLSTGTARCAAAPRTTAPGTRVLASSATAERRSL
jgi:hypothetical protein